MRSLRKLWVCDLWDQLPNCTRSMISSNPHYTALQHVLTCRLITRMNSRFLLCPLSFSICLQMAPAFSVRTQDSLLQHGAFIIRVMTNALQRVCCRALFNRLTVQSCWPSSLLPSGVRSTGWTLPKTLPTTLAQCIRAAQLVLTSLAKVFFPEFFLTSNNCPTKSRMPARLPHTRSHSRHTHAGPPASQAPCSRCTVTERVAPPPPHEHKITRERDRHAQHHVTHSIICNIMLARHRTQHHAVHARSVSGRALGGAWMQCWAGACEQHRVRLLGGRHLCSAVRAHVSGFAY